MPKVKVSIEVRSGAARFDVAVQAESIRRAVSIVASRYPGLDVRMKFPVDPESFFVRDAADRAGITGFEQPQKIAA